MMKFNYFAAFLVFCLLASGFASAEKGGNSGTDDSGDDSLDDSGGQGHGSDDVGPDDKGQGDVNRSQDQDKNKTQEQGGDAIQTTVKNKTKSSQQVLDEARNRTQEHKLELEAKLQNVSNSDKQKVFRNQNTVREAVMALLALREAGNFSGGIGQNISAIARGFDNSVNKTTEAEDAIVSRDGLTRLLFGGDENAARTLQAELNQNRVRLQQLEQFGSELDPEYQPFVEEQLQLMQEEQVRLQELARNEEQNKGLLGWLFK